MMQIALIGAGVMGSLHGRNFGTFEGRAKVTRVFDVDRDKAAALARDLDARPIDTLEEGVTARDVDAVAISIPPRSHRHVVELAVGCGKHVFLEKPIAITLEDAEAIVDLADRSEAQVMVGHVLRFWPGYPELHEMVSDGAYGAPLSVTCLRNQAPPSITGWLADVDATGGIAPLILIHDFDLMNWLLGSPRSVQALNLQGEGVAAKHVVVGVSYDQGNAMVEGSVALPVAHPFSTRLNVYCEAASLHFGYEVEPRASDSGRDASQFTPASPPAITIFPNDGSPRQTTSIATSNPWRPELEHFLDRVEHGLPIENGTPLQALQALRVALAVNSSLTVGGRVAVGE